jgi:hypothetical protein
MMAKRPLKRKRARRGRDERSRARGRRPASFSEEFAFPGEPDPRSTIRQSPRKGRCRWGSRQNSRGESFFNFILSSLLTRREVYVFNMGRSVKKERRLEDSSTSAVRVFGKARIDIPGGSAARMGRVELTPNFRPPTGAWSCVASSFPSERRFLLPPMFDPARSEAPCREL